APLDDGHRAHDAGVRGRGVDGDDGPRRQAAQRPIGQHRGELRERPGHPDPDPDRERRPAEAPPRHPRGRDLTAAGPEVSNTRLRYRLRTAARPGSRKPAGWTPASWMQEETRWQGWLVGRR